MFQSREHGTIWNSLGNRRRRRTIFGLIGRQDDSQQHDSGIGEKPFTDSPDQAKQQDGVCPRNNLIFVRSEFDADCRIARQLASLHTETDVFNIVELSSEERTIESIIGGLAVARAQGIHSVTFVANGQVQRMQMGDGHTVLEGTKAFVFENFVGLVPKM